MVKILKKMFNNNKEVIRDLRRSSIEKTVEIFRSFKFLGTHITENSIKKAHPRLDFLRTLRRTNQSVKLYDSFFHCSRGGVLTHCITVR